MEQLLHYTWMHRLFPLRELRTTDGRLLEVLNPGIHNTDAGPDFTGAKIKLDGAEWAGNVELHLKTSDWFRHHHDADPAYENIILHVACEVDQPLFYPNGQPIPQLQLPVPAFVHDNFDTLSRSDVRPRCRGVVGDLPLFLVHNWMTTLTLQRFEERARQIMQRRESLDKDWEGTLFVTLARSFGFGINGDAFEQWARSIPLMAVGKHRDSLFQIEAIFFGQAGLLEDEPSTDVALASSPDDYYIRLQKEYRFLRHKFTLTPIPRSAWKFLRLRPQNFPHIRIAQLAMLYYEQRLNLSRLLNAESIDEVSALLLTHVSDFSSACATALSPCGSNCRPRTTASSVTGLLLAFHARTQPTLRHFSSFIAITASAVIVCAASLATNIFAEHPISCTRKNPDGAHQRSSTHPSFRGASCTTLAV